VLRVQEVSEKQLEAAWGRAEGAGTGAAGAARATALINRLYKMKVEHLLRLVKTTIFRCALCASQFSAAHTSLLRCPVTHRCACADPSVLRPGLTCEALSTQSRRLDMYVPQERAERAARDGPQLALPQPRGGVARAAALVARDLLGGLGRRHRALLLPLRALLLRQPVRVLPGLRRS